MPVERTSRRVAAKRLRELACALLDASTSGNMLIYGALTASKTINNGDQFKFPTSNLTVQFD